MKLLFKEARTGQAYDSYEFPYLVYAQLEEGDLPDDVLAQGFLPTRMAQSLWYKARSIRVSTKQFTPNSENRRVLRKTDYLTSELLNIRSLDQETIDSLVRLASEYYIEKFGRPIVSEQSLRRIMNGELNFNSIVVYRHSSTHEIVGFAIIFVAEKSMYYAYPAYKMLYHKELAGIGMMTHFLQFCSAHSFEWAYLGSAYTTQARYKLQFSGLEWHSGSKWSSNSQSLQAKLFEKA